MLDVDKREVEARNELAALFRELDTDRLRLLEPFDLVTTEAAVAGDDALTEIEGQIAIRSEPKDPSSPLRGVTRWGSNIGKEITRGIDGQLASVRATTRRLSDALVPSMPPFAMAAAGAPGGGGGFAMEPGRGGDPVVIQLQLDGRTVAELVDRNLYYMSSGPSLLPRG